MSEIPDTTLRAQLLATQIESLAVACILAARWVQQGKPLPPTLRGVMPEWAQAVQALMPELAVSPWDRAVLMRGVDALVQPQETPV